MYIQYISAIRVYMLKRMELWEYPDVYVYILVYAVHFCDAGGRVEEDGASGVAEDALFPSGTTICLCSKTYKSHIRQKIPTN